MTTADLEPPPPPHAVPEGLPTELVQSWSKAIASLTDRELSAVVLRFGFRTGKPESFAAIGRELGANRIRAQAIFRNAIRRLGAQDETRALARYLADLNAALSEEEPAERASRPVPVIEDIDEVTPGDGEDEPEPDREVPVREEANAADDNSAVDQVEPADREEEVADEPVSERAALKLVRAADRELARAVEQCAGREELVAELQRARTRIAAGMREIERAPVEKPVSAATDKRGGGRPFNVAENARRAALLACLEAGEITNAEAAAKLGIKVSAWSSWKVLHRKRTAVAEAPERTARRPEQTSVRRGRGRPENVAETARRVALLARVDAGALTNAEAAAELGLTDGGWASWKSHHVKRAGRPGAGDALAMRLEELERFGVELRQRIREIVALVERWLGWAEVEVRSSSRKVRIGLTGSTAREREFIVLSVRSCEVPMSRDHVPQSAVDAANAVH